MELQSEALVAPERALHLQSAIDLTFDMAHRLLEDPVLRAGIRLTLEQTPPGDPGPRPLQYAQEVTAELLRRAEQNGELLPGLDLTEAAKFIVASFTGLQQVSQVHTGRRDLVDRLATMWTLLLPGLAAPGLLPRLRLSPSA
ncbi:TetR/AcrR family transcriptional regulator [Streptomyces sp. NPDC048275]|uniref:TetR/AcrR family transcriptional regulator n=1 Tax=Streptomyces sp. NPDC048275 TaxID=3155629 RepID=UPI0033CF3347